MSQVGLWKDISGSGDWGRILRRLVCSRDAATGRGGYAGRQMGTRKCAGQLRRRNTPDPRDLWTRPDLHTNGCTRAGIVEKERSGLGTTALSPNGAGLVVDRRG